MPAAQTDFLAFGTDTGASSLTASAAAGSDPFQQLASSSTSRPRAAAPMVCSHHTDAFRHFQYTHVSENVLLLL